MQKQKEKKITNPGKWAGKPYNFFGDYLSEKYSCRILKLPVDAGFTCPNRDGKISTEGCIFCSEEGSASPTTSGFTAISDQMKNAIDTFRRSRKDTKYIAYLQAFTNTYGSIETLKKIYDEAVSFPEIAGLMIGTRPDCITGEILELINSYKHDNFELWLEIGMQSAHDRSLRYLNRGHDNKSTAESINLIAEYGINCCVHVILGIPGESWEDMMHTARTISSFPVNGVKIHHLHIIRNSTLDKIHRADPVKLLTLREYVSIICDFIERLRPDITIHRLAGDRIEESLVAPRWGLHKGTVINSIEEEFTKRYTYQGFLYNPEGGTL